MRTEAVMLAGQAFEIRELPLRRNAEWRQLVAEKYQELFGIIDAAREFDITDYNTAIDLLKRGGELVFSSPDLIIEWTLDYAPELRDVLDGDVYESELMEAFAACLRLAFPFGKLTKLLTSLAQNGSVPTSTPTSQNSQQPIAQTG